MTSLLVFCLTAQAAPNPDRAAIDRFVAQLAAAGCPLVRNGPDQPGGTIVLGGTTVCLGIQTTNEPPESGAQRRVVGFTLETEIPLGENVSLREENRGRRRWSPSPDVKAVPHLGRTATLAQDVALPFDFNGADLRGALESFHRQGEAYARRHRGKFENVPPRLLMPIPGNSVVDRADLPSFERAARAWGFQRLGIERSLVAPDEVTFETQGTTFAVTAAPRGNQGGGSDAFDRFFYVYSTVDLPRSINAGIWCLDRAKKDPGVEFWPCHEGARASIKLGLERGMTLSEIRRRVESFVDDVQRAQSSVRETP